jgi:hypothetical protein
LLLRQLANEIKQQQQVFSVPPSGGISGYDGIPPEGGTLNARTQKFAQSVV